MRFVSPDSSGSAEPFYGNAVCFVGDRLRSFDSRDGATRKRYQDYVRISATGDEYALSSTSYTDRYSPCDGYAVYSVDHLPTSVAGGAAVATDAALCVVLIAAFVWVCVRPIFPRSVFTGLRR